MKKTFRVYFSDGNQRLYEAASMMMVIKHIDVEGSTKGGYTMKDIVRIEEA